MAVIDAAIVHHSLSFAFKFFMAANVVYPFRPCGQSMIYESRKVYYTQCNYRKTLEQLKGAFRLFYSFTSFFLHCLFFSMANGLRRIFIAETPTIGYSLTFLLIISYFCLVLGF